MSQLHVGLPRSQMIVVAGTSTIKEIITSPCSGIGYPNFQKMSAPTAVISGGLGCDSEPAFNVGGVVGFAAMTGRDGRLA